DTEGYEFFVLKGLSRFFSEKKNRPVILCEITPRANAILGTKLSDLFDYMRQYDYCAYHLFNTKKSINLAELSEAIDVVFKIPD
ncbi:MAG: FkbM family methyltransferase, partial [Candidatus Peregrinibacteria bacterium]